MDIERITEVGVAVEDLDAATRLFVDLLGARAGPVYEIERYDMRYCMCRVGRIDFELMAPTGGTGVIADFLRKRGPGLHHIAFAVGDVDGGVEALKAKGVSFVEDPPVELQLEGHDFAGRSFRGPTKITFSHPHSVLGLLLEFIEYPEGYDAA